MKHLPYSHQVPYWRTSQSAWSTWIAKAQNEVEKAGGTPVGMALAQGKVGEELHFMFELDSQQYRVDWPVLPVSPQTKGKQNAAEEAARRQAATFIYHDVKARCVAARVIGAHKAFLSYLLVNGRPVVEALPLMLEAG